MRARRAILYVPGDDLKKIHKAATLRVDCVCLDMEDGVALNRKEQARSTILEALHSIDFLGSEKLVRINPVGSGFQEEDLRQALSGKPDGIVIPKVETAETIEWAHRSISEVEEEHRWPEGAIRLLAAVNQHWELSTWIKSSRLSAPGSDHLRRRGFRQLGWSDTLHAGLGSSICTQCSSDLYFGL